MRVSIFLHSWTPPVLWERYWHSNQARWKPVNQDRVRKKGWNERWGGGWDDKYDFWLSPLFRTASGGWPSICTTHTHTNLLCGVSLSWSTIFPSLSTSYPVAASETGLDAGSRQVKEAIFLQQVRQTAAEERANQLRWWGKEQYCTWLEISCPFLFAREWSFFK